MEDQVKSILFISLSCVGDAVMTTPVLEALNTKYPHAIIDIVTDARSVILYKHCPYRGDVFLKNKKKFLRGAVELLKNVRRKKYDLIVDLRTDGLAYLCHGKKRLTKWGRKPYGSHAVEQLMGTIRSVQDNLAIPNTRVWLTKTEVDFADSLLLDLPGNKWLAFAPGNFNDKKIWPSDNYAALANSFGDIFSGVILDGSKLEKHETRAVGRMLNLPFVNLAGKTNLLQAAAVLRRASLFVGGDSGLGHVAAAMSIPTLTFFSVDRPERVLPWGGNAHWLLSSDNYARNISLEDAINKVRTIINN